MGPWPLHHVPDKVQGLSGPLIASSGSELMDTFVFFVCFVLFSFCEILGEPKGQRSSL